ncbi:hypothetical protein QFW77_06965 [Luteimonas sp. RD2P54]|uniref:CopG family transcriptional regulator n=1 Tax=Luteimonas endophytica TaxID=3042023 RepID=A0ABT6J7C9_9GAMM|nr:hypothetical protein [Luteimonas endophytica]MDH5822735.1 hypothetical protein [Luteimonas endophytica]
MSADGSLGRSIDACDQVDSPVLAEDHRTTLRRLEQQARQELAALTTDANHPAPLQACVDWDLALCPGEPPDTAAPD